MSKKKKISIVIPCYNESGNISSFYKELKSHLLYDKYDFEIIYINDGSVDDTWDKLVDLARNEHIKALSFSRNFGHAAALQAGLEAATGDAIIMMDGDLQQPPSLIPKLISEWENGFDVVKTIRIFTEGVSVFKRITSTIFYFILNTFSGLNLRDGEADFRLVDRKVLDKINSMPESPKFYRGLFNWIGFRSTEVEYKAGARSYGKSSFTIKKMIELARLGLTSFSMAPLKVIIGIGIALSGVSLVGLLIMAYLKIFINYNYVSNNVVLLTVIIFITGILSTFQGIIAVYLVDIFNAVKGRPTYIVREEIAREK